MSTTPHVDDSPYSDDDMVIAGASAAPPPPPVVARPKRGARRVTPLALSGLLITWLVIDTSLAAAPALVEAYSVEAAAAAMSYSAAGLFAIGCLKCAWEISSVKTDDDILDELKLVRDTHSRKTPVGYIHYIKEEFI